MSYGRKSVIFVRRARRSSSSSDDNTSVLAIALVVVAVGVVVYALGLYGMYRSFCQDFASIGKRQKVR